MAKTALVVVLERARHPVEEVGWRLREVVGEVGSAKAFERFDRYAAKLYVVGEALKL